MNNYHYIQKKKIRLVFIDSLLLNYVITIAIIIITTTSLVTAY